LTKKEESV